MMKLRNIAAEEEAKQFLEGASQDDLIALYIDWKKVDGHFSAELKAVENDHRRIARLETTNAALLERLEHARKTISKAYDEIKHIGGDWIEPLRVELIVARKMSDDAIRKAKEG